MREKETILICAWRAERDKDLMANILALYPYWSKVYFFSLYPTKNQWSILREISKNYREFENLFLGDTTHLINIFINKFWKLNEIYWVDDGTATHHRIRQISERTLHLQKKNFKFRPRWATRIMSAFGMLPTFAYRSKFFSIYKNNTSPKKIDIIKNTLSFTKSNLSNKPQSNDIWFIGSNIRNEALRNPDDYSEFMRQISLKVDMRNVTYIPHRKESDDYLKILSEELGFKIKRLDNILEIELTKPTPLPEEFISMGSSAIDTITALIDAKVRLFKIPIHNCTTERQESIGNMYKDAQHKGIEIIELN